MLGEILDTLEVGVVVQDATAKIIWSNRMARVLLGVEESELHSRSSFDRRWEATHLDGSPFPADTHPAVVSLATARAVRGVVMGVTRPLVEPIWLLIDAFPRLDAAGTAHEVVVSFVDVSAQYARLRLLDQQNQALEQLIDVTQEANTHSLEALQRTESRYLATINAMAEGVVIFSPGGGILDANPAAQRLLGLSLEALRRRSDVTSLWAMTRPDGSALPAVETPVERTAKTGVATTGEILGVSHPDGRRRWVLLNTAPIRASAQAPMMGVVATFSDITRQHEAELEVQASQARLRQMTEAVPGVLFELFCGDDESQAFRFLSGAALTVLGLVPADGLREAQAVWACLYPEDVERLFSHWRTSRLAPAPFEVDARLQGGGERWTRWRFALPTREANGWALHGLVVDVTEQRRIAQTLRQAQRQEPLGGLAAGIAHNFNNMLSVILPGIDYARERVDAPLKPMLDDAHRAAESAATLVRQLMSLVRREASDDVTSVDVIALANEVLSLCRKTFDTRVDLSLVTEVGGPAFVRAQRAQLQQVLLNLCINARDAMVRTPTQRLTIRVAHQGESLVLSVSDTGEGMSEATRLRLGELFFTTKPPGVGTGLGIATAVGIVRDLGGTLEWNSTLGVGSTFTVRLPRAMGDTHEADATPAKRNTFHGQTVVVIDDDGLVRGTVARQLRLLGLTVIEASGGRQGLAAIDETVSLVLVDLAMPGMGGDQVLATLRASRPTLPVLVLSGYVPEGTDLAGAWAVLEKPITSAVLERHLGEALRREAPSTPGRQPTTAARVTPKHT